MKRDKERYEAYLNRAEELRAVAETMHNQEARESILRIAADYDKMAAKLNPDRPDVPVQTRAKS